MNKEELLFEKMDWNEKALRISERNMRAGQSVSLVKKASIGKNPNTRNNKTKKIRISKWVKGKVHMKIIHKKNIMTSL